MTIDNNSDDQTLSPEDIAQMNLGTTPVQKPALAPNEPADDPTLDDRLIVRPGQQTQASATPQAAYQEVAAAAVQEQTTTEVPQEEAPPRYFLVTRQNVKLGHLATSSPSKLTDEEATVIKVLPIPSTTPAGVDACINNSNPRSVDENWLETLDRSQKLFHSSTEHQDALARPDSVWSNRVMGPNNQPLTMHRLRAGAGSDSDLRSDRAAMAIRSHIGLGTYANIPLFNSGMWLTLRDPGDVEVQEAIRKQTTERMRVGRSTHAMGFSNHMVYTIETMAELVLQSITSTTTQVPNTELLEHISILDFGTMVWGLASAIYPNGFEYSRACTSGPDKCNDVHREILNINTALYQDESKLTPTQLLHMANLKKNWATKEDLQRYRDQFTSNLGWRVPITASNGAEMFLTMQVPTIAECIKAGHDWISVISNFVTAALGLDADNEHRQAYQRDISLVTTAGEFTQWVKEITIGESTISHRETLRTTFYNDISPDDKLVESLKAAVKDFSTRAMVSTIGVINYTCPTCNRPQMVAEGDNQAEPKKDLPLVVAIDPVSTFFELTYRKFLAIRQRT